MLIVFENIHLVRIIIRIRFIIIFKNSLTNLQVREVVRLDKKKLLAFQQIKKSSQI